MTEYIYLLFSLKKIEAYCIECIELNMFSPEIAFLFSIPLVFVNIYLFVVALFATTWFMVARERRRREMEYHAATLQAATRRKLSLRSHRRNFEKYHSE